MLLPLDRGGVEGTLPKVPSKEERSIKGGEGSTAEVSGRFGAPASFLMLLTLPGLFPSPSSLPVEPTEIPGLGFILNCIQSVCVTQIMRVDLCAGRQLVHSLTTKQDIPKDLLIKGSFRAQRCRIHLIPAFHHVRCSLTIQACGIHFYSGWIWFPFVHFLVACPSMGE